MMPRLKPEINVLKLSIMEVEERKARYQEALNEYRDQAQRYISKIRNVTDDYSRLDKEYRETLEVLPGSEDQIASMLQDFLENLNVAQLHISKLLSKQLDGDFKTAIVEESSWVRRELYTAIEAQRAVAKEITNKIDMALPTLGIDITQENVYQQLDRYLKRLSTLRSLTDRVDLIATNSRDLLEDSKQLLSALNNVTVKLEESASKVTTTLKSLHGVVSGNKLRELPSMLGLSVVELVRLGEELAGTAPRHLNSVRSRMVEYLGTQGGASDNLNRLFEEHASRMVTLTSAMKSKLSAISAGHRMVEDQVGLFKPLKVVDAGESITLVVDSLRKVVNDGLEAFNPISAELEGLAGKAERLKPLLVDLVGDKSELSDSVKRQMDSLASIKMEFGESFPRGSVGIEKFMKIKETTVVIGDRLKQTFGQQITRLDGAQSTLNEMDEAMDRLDKAVKRYDNHVKELATFYEQEFKDGVRSLVEGLNIIALEVKAWGREMREAQALLKTLLAAQEVRIRGVRDIADKADRELGTVMESMEIAFDRIEARYLIEWVKLLVALPFHMDERLSRIEDVVRTLEKSRGGSRAHKDK
ncbi:MAG: hypothetical protein ACE5Z5_08510 [Candidatus Bathyarchaeia archaeon]